MLTFLQKIFGTYYKSNYLSFKLRKIIEKHNIQKAIGLQLGFVMFMATVFIPKAQVVVSATTVEQQTKLTSLDEETITKENFIWPLNEFQLSQGYNKLHPAIDLSTSFDKPIMAIGKGVVETVDYTNWGYGNYLVIKHNNNYSSLYAHLSQIYKKEGEQVEQKEIIGTVGKSGWSTGTHLHLEIFSVKGTINPLDALPSLEENN